VMRVFGAYGAIKWAKVSPASGDTAACDLQLESADAAKWWVENLDGNIPEGLEKPVTIGYKSKTQGSDGSNWQSQDSSYGGYKSNNSSGDKGGGSGSWKGSNGWESSWGGGKDAGKGGGWQDGKAGGKGKGGDFGCKGKGKDCGGKGGW